MERAGPLGPLPRRVNSGDSADEVDQLRLEVQRVKLIGKHRLRSDQALQQRDEVVQAIVVVFIVGGRVGGGNVTHELGHRRQDERAHLGVE